MHVQQLVEAFDNVALRGANRLQLLTDPLLDVAILGAFGGRSGLSTPRGGGSSLRSRQGCIRDVPSLGILGIDGLVLGVFPWPQCFLGSLERGACTVRGVAVAGSLGMRSGASESVGSCSPGGGGTICHEAELRGCIDCCVSPCRDVFWSSQNPARPSRPTKSPAAKAAPKTGKGVMTAWPAEGGASTGCCVTKFAQERGCV